ncbi:YDG domain-containing protein [Sphingobium sufflavum]|nr:YDG domain-containing protein [Sphingobium sufflavum]MCE7798872.1 YDG domain-containing protein [Sphingobium sufflavum]
MILSQLARPGKTNRLLRSALLRTTALVAAVAPAGAMAQELPTSGQVVTGSASIATAGRDMTVTTGTQRTVIDWSSFSIGTDHRLTINQPDASSINVNRVVGTDPSQIFGTLTSNGRVVITNPNGIWFGPSARVDVAGIVASAGRVSDAAVGQFAAGGALSIGEGLAGASVINDGVITAREGGFAALVAPGVRNSGTITARLGQVALASGRTTTVDFYGDGLINLAIAGTTSSSPLGAAVENSGRIIAEGGHVRLSANVAEGLLNNVINMSGAIEARGIATAGGVVELLGGSGAVDVAGKVDVSGAGAQQGGRIAVQAGDAGAADGILNLTGTLDAGSAQGKGGSIETNSRFTYLGGSASANGATGGDVTIKAVGMTQAGTISADATSGSGGSVMLDAISNITQTSGARTSANSVSGAGGSVIARTVAQGRTFSSGMLSATGATGGMVQILGNDIALAAARVDASGAVGNGGAVLVGGDLHGTGPQIASTVLVNGATTLKADAGSEGDGGRVVLWSSTKTDYQGSASARGGSLVGNGGMIEVSSGDLLQFGGSGDASATNGKEGTLLLDPKNIVIQENTGGLATFELIDPNAGLGTGFGQMTANLSNGTIVVTKPLDVVGGQTDVGSVFFYDSRTGALTATLQGSRSGDKVGNSNGDSFYGGYGLLFLDQYGGYDPVTYASKYDGSKAFLITSPNWNGNRGAVTWVAANGLVSGLVSSSNSLVGANAGDLVGAASATEWQPTIDVLANGNYVIRSQNWSDKRGAITFATAGAGIIGLISASNSMVGSTSSTTNGNGRPGDMLGSGGLVKLTNGNFVVLSPWWNRNGGAVTFGNGSSGFATLGAVSSANSLVGNPGTAYSAPQTAYSPYGTVYGFYNGDNVGTSTNVIKALSNGNYLVFTTNWGHGRGAVTLGDGTSGAAGVVSTLNSLVGTAKGIGDSSDGTDTYFTNTYGVRKWYGGDQVGSYGAVEVANGGIVIQSPNWSSNRGAATYIAPGTTNLAGVVSATNSLVGSTAGSSASYDSYHDRSIGGGDQVGTNVFALSNNNYVVASRYWNTGFGAVSVLNGTNGQTVTGSSGSAGDTVSATNSLVGSTAGDYVGNNVITLNGSSDFVTSAYEWGRGKGAVTRISGTSGLAGTVSASNSLVGINSYEQSSLGGDNVGATIKALSSGAFMILSPNWNKTRGAATFVAAGASIAGNISSLNSLVGTTGAEGNSVYCSSCIGGNPAIFGGDYVGSGNIVELANGNVLMMSPEWSQRRGALTYINGTTGALLDGATSLTGSLSAANSLVGSHAATAYTSSYNYNGYSQVGMRYYVGGDLLGSAYYQNVQLLSNGNALISSSYWNNQAGALTFLRANGTLSDGSAFVGTLSSANSLVGTRSASLNTPANLAQGNRSLNSDGDQVGNYGLMETTSGDALLFSPNWNGTRGAVTRISGVNGLTGTLGSGNSLIGSAVSDQLGSYSSAGVVLKANGAFVLSSGNVSGGQGAFIYNNGTSPLTGTPSQANSFLGDATNASYAAYGVTTANDDLILMDFSAEGSGRVVLGFNDATRWTYAAAQGQTLTISPTLIARALGSGTSLVLQANNDITIADAISTSLHATGNLTLEAGRSILGNADISLGTGSLTLLANNSVANGVINAYRDSGAAAINFAAGANISTQGAVAITLASSTDKTNNTGGNITLGAISAATVSVRNLGSASGSLTLGGAISASGSGTPILLATGGAFINNAGASALTPGTGRYLIYSGDPRNNTLGGLVAGGKSYGKTLASDISGLSALDNLLLYSVVPMLTVTGNTTVGYGDSASSVTPTITGFIDGDTATTALTGAATTSTSYQAGNAVGGSYALTIGQGTLASSLGYGFSLVNGTVTVTAKQLTLALTGSVTKEYDRTTGAILGAGNFQLTGLYGSDSIAIGKTAGSFGSANAGTGLGVSISLVGGDFTAGGSTVLGNYVLPTGTTSANIGTITPKSISLTGVTAHSRDYDGTATTVLSGGSLSGVIGGDSVGFSSGTGAFADKGVGVGKAVSLSGYTLTGTSAGNYTLSAQPSGLVATISAKALTLSGVLAQGREYDGTTDIALSSGTLSGILGQDAVSLVAGSGSVTTKDVGTNKAVTASAFTLSGTDAANYSIAAQPTGLTATISGKTLTLSGVSATGRDYDGTASVALTGGTLSGILGSDSISLISGTGSLTSKNAGANRAVTASGFALGGTDAGNYTLSGQPTGLTATIAAKGLTVTGVTASDKVYDNSDTATLSGGTISGVLGNDVASLITGNGAFADKDVGQNKGVTLAGYSLSGADALNYTLTQPGGLTASITARTLTLSGVSATGRAYDGTTSVALTGGSLSGIIGQDAIALVSGTGSIASRNVGTYSVTASGFGLSGADAANYVLAGQPTGLSATISAKAISFAGLATQDRDYDGTSDIALTGGSLSGILGSDAVGFAGGTASVGDKNVGTGKAVTVSGFGLTGADAANYALSGQPTGLTATIAPKALSLSGLTATARGYDGTTGVALTGGALSGVLGNEAVSFTTGTGQLADKNVGVDKAVSLSGFALSGADAGNYVLASQPAGLTATISARTLSLSGVSALDSIYDGTTHAVLSGGTLSGILGSDAISLVTGTGSFADRNVGTNKAIAVSGFGLSGADAANYVLSGQPMGLTASVTPKTLVLGGVSATARNYDGTTAVALSGGSLSGLFGGDAIGLIAGSGSIADKNVGTNKAVSVTGFGLSGTDAGNYILSGQPTGLSVTIAPRAVSLTGLAAIDRAYDGTTGVALTDGTLSGLVATDAVSLVRGTASMADKGVGASKSVTVSGFGLTGANAANYSFGGTPSTLSVAITPKAVTLTGVSAVERAYDGTNAVALSGGTLSGLVASDAVSLVQGSASVADGNAGTAKAVTVSGFGLSGADAANYAISGGQPGGLTVAITPARLSVTLAPGTITKTYDGSLNAVIGQSSYSITGLVAGQSISIANRAGSFASANAGSGVGVSVNLSLTDYISGAGTSLANYALPTGTYTGAAGVILPAALLVRTDDKSKVSGEAMPVLTVSYTGFKGTDSAASTGLSHTFTTAATAQSPAGSYAIQATGGQIANYTVTYQSGIMVVTQAPVQVPLQALITNQPVQTLVATPVTSSTAQSSNTIVTVGAATAFLPTAPAVTPPQVTTTTIGASTSGRGSYDAGAASANGYANSYLSSIKLESQQ